MNGLIKYILKASEGVCFMVKDYIINIGRLANNQNTDGHKTSLFVNIYVRLP